MSPSQREYSIASGPDAFKNQLTTQFPDEAQGIKEFFRLLKRGYQPQGTAAWFAFKLLPLWFVNALRLLGLPRLLSDFYALGDISIKDAFKVIHQKNQCANLFYRKKNKTDLQTTPVSNLSLG